MRIQMICPAPPRSRYGNRVTALRWGRILRKLGHRLAIAQHYGGRPCDLLIALHAKRSAKAVFQFKKQHPEKPLIVALTGTDLYRDLRRSRQARRCLDLAMRLVALQPLAVHALPRHLRSKVRVIYQSAEPANGKASPDDHFFDVCVIGHLRPVKDPFRAARAARRLPRCSRIRVLHAGEAMDRRTAERALFEQKKNPRYRWLGPQSPGRTRKLIRSSRLMVLSSRMEGGANVISEAIVEGVPVLASRIPGSVGLLGKGYPGYFRPGDTEGLRRLLLRCESDARFLGRLRTWCSRLQPLFRPHREQAAWKALLDEVAASFPARCQPARPAARKWI
jgi:putative glycosyltransferase (TIGR04348 family)